MKIAWRVLARQLQMAENGMADYGTLSRCLWRRHSPFACLPWYWDEKNEWAGGNGTQPSLAGTTTAIAGHIMGSGSAHTRRRDGIDADSE
jgi:hypothetical protein